MAEFVDVTRPDGETVTVSRKAFELIYRGRGYEEGGGDDAAPLAVSEDADEEQGEKPRRRGKRRQGS